MQRHYPLHCGRLNSAPRRCSTDQISTRAGHLSPRSPQASQLQAPQGSSRGSTRLSRAAKRSIVMFDEITRKRIRRGVFKSVDELKQAIMDYLDNHNGHPKPYVWTKTAAEIFSKV